MKITRQQILCLYCNKPTIVRTCDIKRGFGRYCSHHCAGKFRFKDKKPPNVTCAYCNVKFYKAESKIKKSKSGLLFCCRKHKDLSQRIGGIKEIMPPHYGTGDGRYQYRDFTLSLKPHKCERCGYDHHLAAIIVHHKDRNRLNNKIENLEVLCANCHAIEHWGKE